MKRILSIELNRKYSKVGVINQYGEVEDEVFFQNNSENLIHILSLEIKTWLTKLGYDYNLDIEKIGIAVPGFVDRYQGTVKLADCFVLKEFNLRKALQKEFKNKRIYIVNSANARALGEFWTGSGANYNSVLYYSLDEKVGGAIIIDGKIILGENGFAGEFGHGCVNSRSQERCECGLSNCLEPIVSTTGITKKVIEILEQNPQHPAKEYFSNFDIKKLNFQKIIQIYQQNAKPLAIKNLLKEILQPLIFHISVMISAINPKSIIIGGEILKLGEDVLEIIQESLQPLILNFEQKELVLKASDLGENAAVVGAAYFAINNWDE